MDPVSSIAIGILGLLGIRKVIKDVRGEACNEVYACGGAYCRQDMMTRLRRLAYPCVDGFGDGDPTREFVPGTLLFANGGQRCARDFRCKGLVADILEISPAEMPGLYRMLRLAYFCEECGYVNTVYGNKPFSEFARVLQPGLNIGAVIELLERRTTETPSREELQRVKQRISMLVQEISMLHVLEARWTLPAVPAVSAVEVSGAQRPYRGDFR